MTFHPRELKAFLAIVDHGSLGRATSEFPISQPALSRLIQQMEVRLGQPLFERHTKGMLPTPAGEALIPHARLLLFEMGRAVETLDELRGLKRGTARIGSVAVANRSIVPKALTLLFEQSPNLRVEILEAPDGQLLDALLNRTIDVIIAAGLPPLEDITVAGDYSFTDSFTLFCSASHPLARLDRVTLDQAFAERWVLPGPSSTVRKLFENQVRLLGRPPPNVAIETSSPDGLVALVAGTRHLGWLPQNVLRNYERYGLIKMLAVDEFILNRDLMAYKRTHGLLPAAAQLFVRALSTVSAESQSVDEDFNQGRHG